MLTIEHDGETEQVTDYEAQCLRAAFLVSDSADGCLTLPPGMPVGRGAPITYWDLVSRHLVHVRARATQRLEELRAELRAERISWIELVELQTLCEHIAPGDVELLEAAGVPEHEEDAPPDNT